MDGPPGTYSLPFEILGNIIVFAADSGGQNVALRLNLVSSSFHNISMKRLYHTLQVDSEAKLELMFSQSGLSRQWVASSVRILLMRGHHDARYDQLLVKVFSALTGLVSLRLPLGGSISPACVLPCLRCLGLTGPSTIPLHLAHHITHIHVVSYTDFVHILQAKEEFRQLTHLLLMWVHPPLFPRLLDDLRNGLPQSLMCLALNINARDQPHSNETGTGALFQDIVETDNRIVLWTSEFVSPLWKKLRMLLLDKVYLTSRYLEALNDGDVGFWELVEGYVREGRPNTHRNADGGQRV